METSACLRLMDLKKESIAKTYVILPNSFLTTKLSILTSIPFSFMFFAKSMIEAFIQSATTAKKNILTLAIILHAY